MAAADMPTSDSKQVLVRATIIRPLSLANASDMRFGSVMPNATAGEVSLLPNGEFSARGLDVVDSTGAKSAVFKIFGTHNQTYSITFPSDASFVNGASAIRVVSFLHDAGGTPTLDQGGNGRFNIGATLSLGQRMAPGTYNGSVDVIISNY